MPHYNLTCFRYLHAKDPKDWTVEKLAEGFPVDKRGVKLILKSKGEKRLESMKNQDKEVIDFFDSDLVWRMQLIII